MGDLVLASSQYQPIVSIDDCINRRQAVISFVKAIMVADTDYGRIPGTAKDVLLKPGAEKLITFFGLSPEFVIINEVLDWDKPLFFYSYKCRLIRNGVVIGEGDGSCNSRESRYAWRWIAQGDIGDQDISQCQRRGKSISEFAFAIDKGETEGQYGKPQTYWDMWTSAIANGSAIAVKKATKTGKELDAWSMSGYEYRVPNPDICDLVNTIQKMAQKRALIAATLIGVNASEFFTQDLEDLVIEQRAESTIVAVSRPVETAPAKPAGKISRDDLVVILRALRDQQQAQGIKHLSQIGSIPIGNMSDNELADLIIQAKEVLADRTPVAPASNDLLF
jgi:hypothetical protein